MMNGEYKTTEIVTTTLIVERRYMFNFTVVDVERRPSVIETLAPLSQYGNVTYIDPDDREKILATLPDTDVFIIRLYPTDRDLLSRAPRLKAVVKAGVGVDHIDVAAATEMGIHVTISLGNYISVAEAAVLLMLSVSRNLIFLNKNPKPGSSKVGKELYAKTLGLVGYGRIGKHVADIATGFGMKVIIYDPYVNEQVQKNTPYPFVSLQDVLREGDFISLHCPATPETHHLIGEKELAAMKKDAILVNTARGAVIDEAALYRALRDNVIAGAGLDVVEHEPLTADNPLLTLENVVVTPHKLIQSVDSDRRQTGSIVASAIAYSKGLIPDESINKDKIAPENDRMKRK